MPTSAEIRQTIRSFILTSFLPGEAPETLKDSTRLVSSGVITSLSMLELVQFLEDEFSFILEPEDVGVGQMDTIDLLVELVTKQLAKRS